MFTIYDTTITVLELVKSNQVIIVGQTTNGTEFCVLQDGVKNRMNTGSPYEKSILKYLENCGYFHKELRDRLLENGAIQPVRDIFVTLNIKGMWKLYYMLYEKNS